MRAVVLAILGWIFIISPIAVAALLLVALIGKYLAIAGLAWLVLAPWYYIVKSIRQGRQRNASR